VTFALSFALMLLAATGLGVGALRGRPLFHGTCRQARLTGSLLPRCEACALTRASGPGRSAAR